MGGGGVMKSTFQYKVAKEHYITINEIFFAKCSGAMYHPFNKVFILPHPFNQHLYNIYKFKVYFLILLTNRYQW